MLTKSPFYHGTTRKMVIAFCGLFNNIFIRIKDTSGVSQKIIPVPLAYANKDKMMTRLKQDPGLNEDVQVSLPRMSAEIVGFDYNNERQLNKIHRHAGTRNGKPSYQYVPVPWDITFNLYTYTVTSEDNFQIMEQILPYFTPDMNLSIKVLQNPDVTQDTTLTLNDVNIDDSYDGSFEDRRYIITTYSFTMQMNYYGPVLSTSDPEGHFENGPDVNVIKKVITNVTSSTNSSAGIKYTATVDPFTANESDQYDVQESWVQDLGI